MIRGEEDSSVDTIRRYFDAGSLLVIFITFALFATALYVTGLTHDLLLEAGVFLVSVKLIVMSYKNAVSSDRLHNELLEIRSLIQQMHAGSKPD
jgi:hypothetical protein